MPKTTNPNNMTQEEDNSVVVINGEVPFLNINFRCEIKNISAVFAGFTTQDGFNGADYVVKLTGVPPSNYIIKQHAKNWFFFYQDYDGNADKPYWIT